MNSHVNQKKYFGDHIHVPFENMIFFGDGETDVPTFNVLNKNNGKSVCIYEEGNEKSMSIAKKLFSDGRVHHVVKNNYEENSDIDLLIKDIYDSSKKIKNTELETLKENYDSKRKLSESFQMMERNSESEALHLEWLEIHKNIQPHELQKRSLLLRLKSLTGEYSGIENICSWKRRKKLKVSKSD